MPSKNICWDPLIGREPSIRPKFKYQKSEVRNSTTYPSSGFITPGKCAPKLSSLILWLTCQKQYMYSKPHIVLQEWHLMIKKTPC
jgi:hypothetical protein